MSYNLEDLRAVNLARATDPVQAGGYGHAHGLRDWSEERWALAMIGEAGETCNAVKKVLRGDGSVADVAEEAADTVIYLDLLLARLGLSLHDAVQAKFNRKSEERGSPHRLTVDAALTERVRVLEQAIAAHRDQRGDDRCWLDDLDLYAKLGANNPIGSALPPREEFLANCARFHASRQPEGLPYVSDRREIERLSTELDAVTGPSLAKAVGLRLALDEAAERGRHGG